MQFWLPIGGNNAGGFQQAEIMQFWIPEGGNDAVLASSRRKWRNFGCQQEVLLWMGSPKRNNFVAAIRSKEIT